MMTREQQLADAYIHVATIDHHMVGIVENVTDDERDAAEQILIAGQNELTEDNPMWRTLDLALDLIENDRRARS
jgi:hypothetical protein